MLRSEGYIFDLPREYLKPALMVSLLSVWVLVGLFFYLNAYTRRRYFTIWSAGWLFYALWLTLSLSVQEVGPSPFLLMLKQWCVCMAALFMIWGASTCLEQPPSERVFGLFLGFLLIWSYLAAYHGCDLIWVKAAVFAMLGLGSGLTAYSFYRFRRRYPYMGAGLLSVGFLLWGGYLASYPWWEVFDQLITPGFFISTVLQLFIAISMIILVLEEVRTSNQRALLQIEQQKSETDGLRTRILSTEERYRSLFAQASEGIVIAAADDLRILELNDAAQRLLGITSAESSNKFLSTFLRFPGGGNSHAPDTGDEWFKALTEHHRVELVRSNGTPVPAEVAGAPLAFDGVSAYQFFFREVTERARLEQQLRQAEKLSALGQMISGVAHELNNPLAVIKGYLDLILARHDLGKQTRADLEKAAHESNRAAKLVNNFLSFARERVAQRESVDMNQLVQRVVELRELDLRILGVQAELQLDPELPKTEADASQLEQVMVNLVGNALHALAEWPDARRLKVTTQLRGDIITLRVEDSGPGVPPQVLPHIFEPFFTTKQVGCGTGLGLSIAHSIVAEHQGRIYHQPSSEGGAAFVIELPIVEPSLDSRDETPDATQASLNRPPASPPGARILVLDDEAALGEMLAELLMALGHVPVTCNSALRALELVEEQPFDVILSDFRMPLMNGRQFYERLSQSQPALAKRIVFVTGDVVNQETRAFLDVTGNLHLTKPFRLESIEAVVATVLQSEAILVEG